MWLASQLLLGLGTLLSVGIGSLVLLSRTPLEETMESLGILGFGLPYFAVPLASIYSLHHSDPWLVFLLFAIVWFGDTAAFYVGSRFGRHKMAPTISPGRSCLSYAFLSLPTFASWAGSAGTSSSNMNMRFVLCR